MNGEKSSDMTKKKRRQQRQQHRQQQRAAKTVARQRQHTTNKNRQSNNQVLFERDEAAVIAEMMTGGSGEFASQIGGMLLVSEMLLDEPEFSDLAIDKLVYASVALPVFERYNGELEAVEEADREVKEEAWLNVHAEIAIELMQTDFRETLLERLNRFIERTRQHAGREAKWRSAVALKLLLEQPPSNEQIGTWRLCSLLLELMHRAGIELQRQIDFEDIFQHTTDDDEPLSPVELFDALEGPLVLERVSAWMAARSKIVDEDDEELDSLQHAVWYLLLDEKWTPPLFLPEDIAAFIYVILEDEEGRSTQEDLGLTLAQEALALIAPKPGWYAGLTRRLRGRQRDGLVSGDRSELERWLGLELLIAGWKDDLTSCPILLVGLINQYNEMIQDPARLAELRIATERVYPDLPVEKIQEFFEEDDD